MFQSWEALKTLMQRLATGETTEALAKCKEAVARAMRLYDNITIQLDQKSKDDHLEGLQAGLIQFATLAEIDSTQRQASARDRRSRQTSERGRRRHCGQGVLHPCQPWRRAGGPARSGSPRWENPRRG